MIRSDVPEAHLAVPASRVDHVGSLRVELAGEDLVAMGRLKDPIANLLNLSHSYLVVDLDVGLGASDTEATKVPREVNRMESISFIKADMLNRITHT